MPEHFDAIVVGSGFGGSVAAHRLAHEGWDVCVLERGKAYGPGDFPRNPSEMAGNFWDPSAGRYGLFEVWTFRHLEALVAAGLGGGSLIYANVLLRKPEKWFVHDSPYSGGYEHWPVTREDLDPFYDEVEGVLGATPFPLGWPGYPQVPKAQAMLEASEQISLEWSLPNLAVSFAPTPLQAPEVGATIPTPAYGNMYGRPRRTCRLCGECDIGCNDGAKNTLDHTYLSAAKFYGAEIRPGCEVVDIAPQQEPRRFTVEYVDRSAERPVRKVLTATRLILAAGSLGTTYLLLRNRKNFPHLGTTLGTRFSGNGDDLGFVVGVGSGLDDVGGHRPLLASTGPVITSAFRRRDAVEFPGGNGGGDGAPRGFYIEDAGYPAFAAWIAETTRAPASLRRLLRLGLDRLRGGMTDDPRSWLRSHLNALIGAGTFSAGTMPLLGMGRDVPDGRLYLRDGWLQADINVATSKRYYDDLRNDMRNLAEALGGRFVDDPLARFRRQITVHPVGGAPMGRHIGEGVVDGYGESFVYKGLYVLDGAAMPGPVGANPALTIAAFAERAAQHMVQVAPVAAIAPFPPGGGNGAAPPADARTSLTFAETMKGFVTAGQTDYGAGAEDGDRVSLSFDLFTTIDDVDGFLDDPLNGARAEGWIECGTLGGRLIIQDGTFNLFVAQGDGSVRMLYRLPFRDGHGRPLTLSGYKALRDGPGFDPWSDASTLKTRLLVGHPTADEVRAAASVPDPDVWASGILRISPAGFIKLLTSLRPKGAHPMRGLERFGGYFAGTLWDLYAPPAANGAN